MDTLQKLELAHARAHARAAQAAWEYQQTAGEHMEAPDYSKRLERAWQAFKAAEAERLEAWQALNDYKATLLAKMESETNG